MSILRLHTARRHRETCERLDEERKKSAGKDDELQALHARLASQNRALVEQLETIEQVCVCVCAFVLVRVRGYVI